MSEGENPTIEEEEESVELIASGYEWSCPNCDKLNEEIEIRDKVKCAGCGRGFEVENADHALG